MRGLFSRRSFCSGATLLLAICPGHGAQQEEDWHLPAIRVPRNLQLPETSEPVVVAIVDDAFRKTHRDLKDFIWANPGETPFNRTDDDRNGYVDDVRGWDAADGDSDCAPPADRLEEFYHGTYLGGIIAGVARAALGERASERIKLLPVKALSDYATQTYLKSGFQGIEYAASLGADIILCAWTVGSLSSDQARILQKASDQGAFIVASAGNFPENREVFPAAHASVFSVAGLDRLDQKMEDSNYGTFVDLSAPGEDIRGASSKSDDGFLIKTGTSQAAALVAATAALVKASHPDFSAQDLRAALKNSADPLNPKSPLFLARLGSGKLNARAAVEAAWVRQETASKTAQILPQGHLRYANAAGGSATWEFSHSGDFEGTWFTLERLTGSPESSALAFFPTENGVAQTEARKTVVLSEMDGPVFLPGGPPLVMFLPDKNARDLEWRLEYRMEPVDLPSLYCQGTLERTEEGSFEDGSGPNVYSPQSNCFWHIKAPPGKAIRFQFTEFDTESGRDLLYFFDGRETNAKIMAVFSGPEIPPTLTTWRNEVLVWFVTDSVNQHQGWKGEFRFVQPAAGKE